MADLGRVAYKTLNTDGTVMVTKKTPDGNSGDENFSENLNNLDAWFVRRRTIVQPHLVSISVRNQGYIYLIHAEGTTRYKIGRSVNPIARCSNIQKQAPYPLKIILSFWAFDAISAEKRLHECFAEYRVFGEWFDLGDTDEFKSPLWKVLEAFYFPDVVHELSIRASTYLCSAFGFESTDYFCISECFIDLYRAVKDGSELYAIDNFIIKLATENNKFFAEPTSFNNFIEGAVTGFIIAWKGRA